MSDNSTVVRTKNVVFHRGFYIKTLRVGLREVKVRIQVESETSGEEVTIDWTRDPGEALDLWSEDLSFLFGLGYGTPLRLDYLLTGLTAQEAGDEDYTFPPHPPQPLGAD